MKNKIFILIFAVSITLSSIVSSSVYAVNRAALGTLSPPPATKVNAVITIFSFLNFALGSSIVAFLAYFSWGAVQWIMSEGDKANLDAARKRMTSAAIGVIILALVYAIFFFVQAFTYNSTDLMKNITPPTPPCSNPPCGVPF